MLTSELIEREAEAAGGIAAERHALLETPAAISIDARLHDAIELFRSHSSARFLAVTDGDGRPVGAVHERLVRDLLFSPIGHALLANPACCWSLADYVRPCPQAEFDDSAERWLNSLDGTPGAEGVIMTRHGRYLGLLPGTALLQLAATREREASRRKLRDAEAALARSQRLSAAFDSFQADAVAFATALADAAAGIEASAAGIAERAAANRAQSLEVAAASSQSAAGVAEVAASSTALAAQVQGIEAQVAEAKQSARRMVAEVPRARARPRAWPRRPRRLATSSASSPASPPR